MQLLSERTVHEIYRWRNSRSAVLQIAIVYPLGVGIFGLFTWYALTDPELTVSARLASLIMVAIIFVLLRAFVVEILLGRSLETYLLSRRTLAIVRKGRPTRFLKPRDLAQFYPRSDSFSLRDGKSLTFHVYDTPGSKRRLAEKVVTLWYSESEYAAAREAYRIAHFPPRWIDIFAFGVIFCALATLIYGGMLENGHLIWGSLSAMASLTVFYVVWSTISGYRVTWPLGRGSDHADGAKAATQRSTGYPTKVLRFPTKRPSLTPQIVGYTLLFLFAAIFIPVCRFLLHIPRESGGHIYVGCFAFLGLLFTFNVARHCHHTLIRGNLFETALFSTRTLAIFRAGKPVQYVKRKDIAAFRPNRQLLILSNGSPICVGFTCDLGNSRGLMEALWKNWWDFVPIPQRTVPNQGAGIGWTKGTIASGLISAGFGVMLYGGSIDMGWLALPGLALVFFALWYYVQSLVKRGDYFQVSLRREDYE